MIFELFKPQNAGGDLLASLLIMFNEMKSNMFVPDFMKIMSITSFYKNRGNKDDLSNDRGVFNLVKVRSLLDKMIYNDIYPDIDKKLSQSNIGARRGRNIRDHLFVIYSIINEIKTERKEDLEIQSIDIVKCYDELNYSETHNDLYDAGVKDDKFNLISKLDDECFIRVKTPVGPSEQFKMNELILQRSVLGPIKCSVQLDTLGRDSLSDTSEQSTVFKYKDSVEVPPLALMDDVLAVSTCGIKAVEMNASINSKIEGKKLRLNHLKCHKMHIKSKGSKIENCETNPFAHNEDIKEVIKLTYLGDVLSNSKDYQENIDRERVKPLVSKAK